jgi:hypothetical protein
VHTNARDRQAAFWKLARPSSAQRKVYQQLISGRADADTWALETERTIDKGIDPKAVNPRTVTTFSEVIDLHIEDMLAVGKKQALQECGA